MNNSIISLFIIVFSFVTNHLQGQSFTSFLKDLESISPEKRQLMVDNFKLQRHNYPIVDSDTTVYYICYVKAGSVKLTGDFTNWSPGISLNPVTGTDLWYYKAQYPRDGRIEYKFIIDGQWGLDALNPSKALGGFGANSELTMPAYRESDLLQAIRNVPKGLLSDHELHSNSCKELRHFKIYLPAGYQESNQQYPVVIYHDGEDYLAYTGILTILDNLSFSPINLPLIAVFVKPVLRDPEYSGKRQEAYTAFIVNELMPYLEKNYRILSGPENHVISGISNGGNIALWISGKYPDVFGKVAVHSSNIEKSIFNLYKKRKALPSRLYLEIGIYDIPALQTMYQGFTRLLARKNITHAEYTFSSGHNWNAWQNQMGEALIYLLPGH